MCLLASIYLSSLSLSWNIHECLLEWMNLSIYLSIGLSIYPSSLSLSLYIYIYMYICVCVCVCVRMCACLHLSIFITLRKYTWMLAWVNKSIYLSIIFCSTIIMYIRLHGLVGRVFTNGQGNLGSIPGCVIPKTLKIIIDSSMVNTQQYKVRIKGKVEQSRERSSALPYTSV